MANKVTGSTDTSGALTTAPSIMKSICKVLGISENGTLGSLLTSRVVLAAVCGELGLTY